MTAVYALFPDANTVQRAVEALRAHGISDHDITIVSSMPLEVVELGGHTPPTWMFRAAAAGGVAGLSFAFWLTSMAERAWPINTGNMPIVATWPNLIVMFELTMLGAILATVVTLLITAKLPSRLPRLYDPEVTNGYILVGVQQPAADLAPALTAALERAGEGRIKTIE